jgi:hypothetical protein
LVAGVALRGVAALVNGQSAVEEANLIGREWQDAGQNLLVALRRPRAW